MAGGRISLLVSKDLGTLVQAAGTLDREVRGRLRAHTKGAAQPIWQDEITHRTGTRLQTRVLVDSARLAVSDTNVTLKSAQVGKLRSGTPRATLASAAEFGGNPGKQIRQRSRRGKVYTRRLGNAFGAPRRKGNVFHPAFADAVPRVASLWLQTAIRTVAETFEKAGR